MINGAFKRKTGFTVVQNGITEDLNVSMKAKGLYLIIQSKITQPNKNWLKKDFEKKICEGEKAFDAAWNELKEKGYLKTTVTRSKGKLCYNYELLDEADYGPHTFYYDEEGNLIKTNLDKKADETSKQKPDLPFRGVENVGVENVPPVKEGAYINTINANTNNINTISINPNIDNTNDNMMDVMDYEECEKIIKDNIDYEKITDEMDEVTLTKIDEMVSVIVDALTSRQEEIRIGKKNLSYDQVKERLLKIKREHIENVINSIDNYACEIKNLRAYLLVTLYNSISVVSFKSTKNEKKSERKNVGLCSLEYSHDYDFDEIERILLAK